VLSPECAKIIHFPGHLMFYAPFATEKTVGGGEGAPYVVHPGQPDALMIVVPAAGHERIEVVGSKGSVFVAPSFKKKE
jgi:hypothetical protein